ncbi:MAG: domain containing rane protein [Pseudomonadota bacterium]|jgi:CBS domain-containing protein
MTIIRDILNDKGDVIHAIAPGATVFEAIEKMATYGIGALIVTDNGRMVGIVCERDYARKVILQGRSSIKTPVRDIMTSEVICIGLNQTVDEGLSVMTQCMIRHLPVLEDGRLKGIVSIGDLVKAKIAEQEFTIEQMALYVQGN